MDFTTLENQFKVLGSEKRLRVIESLIENKEGLRFSEIAKTLDIYPSTLEDHLKRLLESGFISHANSRYRLNVNTERVHLFAKSLHENCTPTYFSTHLLSIDDESLKERFLTLKCDGVFDILSLMNKAKLVIDGGLSLAKVGGAMNMQMEISFFEFYPMNLKNSDLEVLFTRSLLEEFLQHEKKELFLQGLNPDRTKLFIVDECKVAMMTTANYGAIFLPTLDGVVDFTHGLFFSDQLATQWLNDFFDHLKSTGDELSNKEIRMIWK